MEKGRRNLLTLDRLVTYDIAVPGMFDVSSEEWAVGLRASSREQGGPAPVTVLSGEFDQAARHGLRCRLYCWACR